MIFRTKGELLEYLGKNKTDNKLVDRMIIRWEVNKTSEGYEYIDKDREEIERLKIEVQRLSNEVEELKDEKWKLVMELISKGEESSENEEENEVAEKVYQYMTKVLHLRVNHDEYIEWIENN